MTTTRSTERSTAQPALRTHRSQRSTRPWDVVCTVHGKVMKADTRHEARDLRSTGCVKCDRDALAAFNAGQNAANRSQDATKAEAAFVRRHGDWFAADFVNGYRKARKNRK